jgi:hypothetical protein
MQMKKNKVFEKQAFKHLLTFSYLKNANQLKYGSILSGLNTQQLLGNDQYPKSIGEANNMLSNHHFNAIKQGSRFFNKNLTKNSKKEPEQEKINLSFAQLEGKCYCCGKTGHKSPQCQFKDKPKSEWSINKTQQSHAQTSKALIKSSQDLDNQSTGNIKSAPNQIKKEGWAGVHHLFYLGQDMMDWILLDNESTTTIFCNPDMVQDIHNIKNESLNLVTNASILRTTHKASKD